MTTPARHKLLAALAALAGSGLLCTLSHAAAPASLLAYEHALSDHPVEMLATARRELESGATSRTWGLGPAARAVAAARTVEDLQAIDRLLPQALLEAQAPGADLAWCEMTIVQLWRQAEDGPATARLPAEEQAMQQARTRGLDWCEARLRMSYATRLDDAGRLADAAKAFHASLAYFESQGDVHQQAIAHGHLGWLAQRNKHEPGSLKLALEHLRAALALAEGLSPPPRRLLASFLHDLGGSQLAAGDVAQARANLERAEQIVRSIGDEVGAAYVARLLARADLLDHAPAMALTRLRGACPVFERAALQQMIHTCAVLTADALRQGGRADEALQVLRQAEPVRQRLQMAERDAEHQRAMLLAQARAGQDQEAAKTAEAFVQAVERREAEAQQQALADANARFQTERREAENRLLREQRESAHTRIWLLATSLLLLTMLLAVGGVHLVQQRRVRQRLRVLAEVDELTQLPNRRALMERLRQEMQRARSSGRPLAVGLCDIDHFKRVNDRYGHDVGDAALRCFAQVGQAAVRDGDTFGRLGGEEFLLLLPGTRPADAAPLFARLLAGLQATPVPGMADDERLSFSMGVAAWQPELSDVELLRLADQALYRAKDEGRSRMACWTPEPG